ncbi:MAG: cation diffusion facilitator family transporter [Mycetocola sp.]
MVKKARAIPSRLVIAFAIAATILVAEVIGAFITGSLALLVDAAHMLTDAGGLLIALIGARLALRAPTSRRTWSFRRAEVLSATAQAAIILAVGLYAFIELVKRLFSPTEVSAVGLLVFGIIGMIGNIVAIAIPDSRRSANLNLRAWSLKC